jgi:sulfite reductase (ferredoxin)
MSRATESSTSAFRVSSGRIVDSEQSRIRTALREIVERFRNNPILMPSQDIILSKIQPEDRGAIESVLREHEVRLSEDMLPAERWTLACPALPSCGLALTEAERVSEDIVAAIEARLRNYGLERERLSIRITGCPNGCARPYTGDIGIVGRMPGFYALFVGGDFAGTRLNTSLADKIPLSGIAEVLDPLFALFASARAENEGFGDFCHRIGMPALQQALAGRQRGAA